MLLVLLVMLGLASNHTTTTTTRPSSPNDAHRHEGLVAAVQHKSVAALEVLHTFSVASTTVFQVTARHEQRLVLVVPKAAAAFRDTAPLEPAFMALTMAIVDSRSRCRNATAAVVDAVGGSFGQQLALAALFGCAVVAFEPVPRYASFQQRTFALNELDDAGVRVVAALLGNASAPPISLLVPARDCWSCTAVRGRDVDAIVESNVTAPPPAALAVSTADLSASLPPSVESVLLARVAVAGWEGESLRALLAAPRARVPLNILLTVHTRAHAWPADVLDAIDAALAHGFVGRLLPLHWVRRLNDGATRWLLSAPALFAGRDKGAAVQHPNRVVRSAARWGNVSMAVVPFQSAAELAARVPALEQQQLHAWLSRDDFVVPA